MTGSTVLVVRVPRPIENIDECTEYIRRGLRDGILILGADVRYSIETFPPLGAVEVVAENVPKSGTEKKTAEAAHTEEGRGRGRHAGRSRRASRSAGGGDGSSAGHRAASDGLSHACQRAEAQGSGRVAAADDRRRDRQLVQAGSPSQEADQGARRSERLLQGDDPRHPSERGGPDAAEGKGRRGG